MAMFNQRRLKEIKFLEDFLRKYPDLNREKVRVVLARNMGWAFTKTDELLRVIKETGTFKDSNALKDNEPIEIPKRPENWGKFIFPK